MPAENLTRDEAEARAAVLDVESYEIWLDVTAGGDVFASRTEITFACGDPGGSTFADLIAPTVRSVALNRVDLDPAAVFADSRVALSGLRARNCLVVEADCAYMRSDEGLHRFVDPVDDRTYLWTQFEAADARRVFACFEQPDLKASFTLHVTAPADWTVVSNAATPEPVAVADVAVADVAVAEGAVVDGAAVDGVVASRRWDFAPTERIATYLLAVVAGPYHRASDSFTGAAAEIPLGWLCRASIAEHLDADALFAFTKAGLAFYEDRFATPYPFTTYDQVFVPEYSGAMEHPGCVTFTEDFVFRSRQDESAHAIRAIVLLHEMAHMWFGDLVTMRWWDDLWLNESFAEWASHWSTVATTRFTDAWVDFAIDKGYAYRADQLRSTHPVAADVVDLDTAESIFDGITYGKGASVLRQLVAWVGEDAFLAGLRAHFADHAYGNATFADLLHALEVSSGRPLGDWAQAWLATSGVSTLRPRVQVDPDGRYIAFDVVQSAAPQPGTQHPTLHPTLRPHRLAIGLFVLTRSGSGGPDELVRTGRVELDVDGAVTPVTELLGEPAADLVLLNDGDLTYAKVRFDERSLRSMRASVDTLTEPLARAMCWTAAWDTTRDGEMAASDWVDLVLRGLGTESHPATVQALCGQVVTAVERYTDPARRDAVRQRWTAGLRALLTRSAAGSDVQLLLVRALAASAVTEDDVALLAAQLDGTDVLPGLAVDTELRWLLLTGLARCGRLPAGALEQELRRDPTRAGQESAAAAAASVPDPAAKTRAWELAVHAPDTAGSTRRAVMRAFWHNGQGAALDGWVERYFTEAAIVWGRTSSGTATEYLRGMFPAVLASPALVDRAERFLQRDDLDPSVRRYVGQGLDDAVRAVAAQARDRAAAGS